VRKACLVVATPYLKNQIFERGNSVLNRDHCLTFFHDLQDAFASQDVALSTQDVNSPLESEFVIYNEMPSTLPTGLQIKKSYLLLFESELIRPDNWNKRSHKHFSKIFTWNDDLVDNEIYFKMNFTHFGSVRFVEFSEKTKFCTLIAGNKSVQHPLELYSERRKIIRWFENNQPEKFRFFGMGWNEFTFAGPKLWRALNRWTWLRRLCSEPWPSYGGKVDSKLSTLSNYKFSICFENARDIPGYITEKIFDSMAAGCVPVYWGAPNIADYVPELCYVDMKKFKNYEEMYVELSKMTSGEYQRRQDEIYRYLQSSKHELFTPEANAAVIALNIIGSTNAG
jgi:hypothetical protein